MTPCPMCTGNYGAHQFGCPLYVQAAPPPTPVVVKGIRSNGPLVEPPYDPDYRRSGQVYRPTCAECQGTRGNCTCPDAAPTSTNPAHYTRMTPQPIEVISTWGLNFNLGNVVKYVARAGHKNGATYGDDLAKAADYLAREIARTAPERSTK